MDPKLQQVTEEDMKNLFWQQTLHTIRQGKMIDELVKQLKESQQNEVARQKELYLGNVTDIKQAQG